MKNENALFRNDTRFIISGKIIGLSAEIKKVKTRMDKITSKSESLVFGRLVMRKRMIGGVVRHHLLAYAFLKGKNYLSIERKLAEGNAPDAEYLFKIIQNHAPTAILYQKEAKLSSIGYKSYKVTLEDVSAWLAEKAEELTQNIAV